MNLETYDNDQDRTLTDLSSIVFEDSDEKNYRNGRWTADEHKKFLKALILFGNNWKKVQSFVTTRSPSQARSHAQKYFIRIKNKILKDFNRTNFKSFEDSYLCDWISKYINEEVTIQAEENLSDKTENLKKVLLQMCKNSTKVRKSSNGSEYVDNYFINDVDDYFKNVVYEDKKKKPFKIEKVGKSPNTFQTQPIIQNHVFNQPVNSYINIVTINVCKNENKEEETNPINSELLNSNPFYYNFINDNKIPKNRFKVTNFGSDKKPDEEKTNTAFNLNFEYDDDLNKLDRIEDDYNHFDLNQFFNSY
jgi:SHAQKYF class myb-like DNA-binding protein